MSTTGKIKTLFSDIEKTEALFPRTKISAISNEDGMGLDAVLQHTAYVGESDSNVRTLFSDLENTEALFPTTKVKAISDDNGVGLDALLSTTVHTGPVAESAAVAPVNADTLGGRKASEYATQNYVASEIAKAQLECEDVDLSGYATKDYAYDTASEAALTALANAKAYTDGNISTWVGDSTVASQIASAVATKAPAGYGLGGYGKNLYSSDDINNITANGWYSWQSSTPANAPASWSSMLVMAQADHYFQLVYIFGTDSVKYRYGIGGTWYQWNDMTPRGFAPASHTHSAGDVGASPVGHIHSPEDASAMRAFAGLTSAQGNDFNNCTTQGFYLVNGYPNANCPRDGYGILQVYNHVYATQIFYCIDGSVWQRTHTSMDNLKSKGWTRVDASDSAPASHTHSDSHSRVIVNASTAADVDNILNTYYAEMSNGSTRLIQINDTTGNAFNGGSWLVTIGRIDAGYGYAIAHRYDYGSIGVATLERSRYNGVWDSWVHASSQHFSRVGHTHSAGDVGAQPALGYTPVRQGTGHRQNQNAVALGWTGSRLALTVDATDCGDIYTTYAPPSAAEVGALSTSGGTMTGHIDMGWYSIDNLGWLSGVSGYTYGTSLPSAGNAGRIFFKKVSG